MIAFLYNGVWLSLVERCVRDAEAAGSNPATPTTQKGCSKLRKFTTSFLLKARINSTSTGIIRNDLTLRQVVS